ncbi:MAG: hypothetical protein ABIR36_04285, partial [Nitrospiraceae bacterium]
MSGHRQPLEPVSAIFRSRVLAHPCGSPLSEVRGHDPLTSGELRLRWFPKIHTRACYFKVLLCIEDPRDVLGAGHVHDPEAEGMAALIPQHVRQYDCSKREEGLAEFVISAKAGQPTDINRG